MVLGIANPSTTVFLLILFWQQQRGGGPVRLRDDPQPRAFDGEGREYARTGKQGVFVGFVIVRRDVAPVAALVASEIPQRRVIVPLEQPVGTVRGDDRAQWETDDWRG